MRRPGDACYRNAVAFDGFCRDVEAVNGKVTVGLSGTSVPEPNDPPHDLVVRVVTSSSRISARVTGQLGDTIAQLREKLNLAC